MPTCILIFLWTFACSQSEPIVTNPSDVPSGSPIASANPPEELRLKEESATLAKDRGLVHPALKALLDNPLNLAAYKKKWGPSNSGLQQKTEFFHLPDVTGTFYRYMRFGRLRKELPARPSEGALMKQFEITVYRYGTEIGDFYDTNEELIAVKCALDNPTLGALNWYGKTRRALFAQYGEPQLVKGDYVIYLYEHKVMIAHFKDEQVNRFQYVRLNPKVDLHQGVPNTMLEF
ncbi:MAG: hypothetical protein VX278_18920 [Myxococcota bacterium]|nr:hypothetical protein [Myxococcota bacterium]